MSLQITFTPREYQEIVQRYTHGVAFRQSKAGLEYWGKLPNYVISRCPFCNAVYTSLVDTHSLTNAWIMHPDLWKSVTDEEHQHIGCSHFVAVQTFVNFNGLIPTELSYFENRQHVPFIMPTFVPDDISSVAVIHSLPICRIEKNTFIPRYSAYMVTYYAENPKGIWERRRARNDAFGRGDPDSHTTMLFTCGEAHTYPTSWDLPYWVSQGKLQWLSPSADLIQGPAERLPYQNIQGYRRPFVIRNGRLEFDQII